MPQLSDQPASILILHAGALGDFVLTTHLVRALRQAYPKAVIAAAARTRIVHWFAEHRIYGRAYDIEQLDLHQLFGNAGGLPADSPLKDYDVIVSFLAGPETPVLRNLRRLTGAHVIAVDPAPDADTRDSPRHITAQWLGALRRAHLPLPDLNPMCSLTPQLQEAIEMARPPRVICHPGSGGKAKCAPVEHFEELVTRLRSRGVDVRWMIGPAERDWYGQSYVDRLARSAPVVEQHDVCAAADLLSEATDFVGNDAGVTHLAAAIGLQTTALFGPTDPTVWRPMGPHVRIVGLDRWNSLGREVLSRLAQSAVCD